MVLWMGERKMVSMRSSDEQLEHFSKAKSRTVPIIGFNYHIIAAIIVVLAQASAIVESRSYIVQSVNDYVSPANLEASLLEPLKKRGDRNWEELDPSCPVYKNEPLHAIMDRVCEMCHEMFSHEQNSLRAECRKNCFRNEKFRECLELFSPAPSSSRVKRFATSSKFLVVTTN